MGNPIEDAIDFIGNIPRREVDIATGNTITDNPWLDSPINAAIKEVMYDTYRAAHSYANAANPAYTAFIIYQSTHNAVQTATVAAIHMQAIK